MKQELLEQASEQEKLEKKARAKTNLVEALRKRAQHEKDNRQDAQSSFFVCSQWLQRSCAAGKLDISGETNVVTHAIMFAFEVDRNLLLFGIQVDRFW